MKHLILDHAAIVHVLCYASISNDVLNVQICAMSQRIMFHSGTHLCVLSS